MKDMNSAKLNSNSGFRTKEIESNLTDKIKEIDEMQEFSQENTSGNVIHEEDQQLDPNSSFNFNLNLEAAV
jgi:hypothetical protein